MSQHDQTIAEKKLSTNPLPEARGNQLLWLAVSILIVGLVGALLWDFKFQNPEKEGLEHNTVLGLTIFIQAMIAFFGILSLEEPHNTKVSPLTKGGMRTAITGAFVVTYLSLVIFHTMVEFTPQKSLGGPSAVDPFVTSFTTLVGITIFFYFASEAAIHWINVTKGKE